MVSLEDLADLSPNMRKVLRDNSLSVHPKTTYWITLQGMIARGLLDAPQNRHEPHALTQKGLDYREAIIARENQ